MFYYFGYTKKILIFKLRNFIQFFEFEICGIYSEYSLLFRFFNVSATKGISHNEQIQWNFCNNLIAFLLFIAWKKSINIYFEIRLLCFYFNFHSLSQQQKIMQRLLISFIVNYLNAKEKANETTLLLSLFALRRGNCLFVDHKCDNAFVLNMLWTN